MSGVWVFNNNGVLRLIENPNRKAMEEEVAANSGSGSGSALAGRTSVLVHVATGKVVGSHQELEAHLGELGWVPYTSGNPELIQYHRSPSSVDLISLPKRFSDLRSTHMYDIAFKNRNAFIVQDRPRP
ncbi:putative flowering-promoting factor 1 [Dioscorea sansibarensis]